MHRATIPFVTGEYALKPRKEAIPICAKDGAECSTQWSASQAVHHVTDKNCRTA
jgi:hypothetical protein